MSRDGGIYAVLADDGSRIPGGPQQHLEEGLGAPGLDVITPEAVAAAE